MSGVAKDIFRRGSTTFYNSSRFFPKQVREDVTTLYAFVRRADDFVDSRPQDPESLARFRRDYEGAMLGEPVDDEVVRGFVRIAGRYGFDPAWVERFLDTMAQDLWKTRYDTLEETLDYVHGSAEVIGLMMARILGLPPEADEAARLLGRAFQYVNFVRDIDEDAGLGRVYLPLCEARAAGLEGLDRVAAESRPEGYRAFVRSQLVRYRGWRREAEAGFRFIPRPCLIPIATAAGVFDHTASVIERDPFVVFRRKVKPTRTRVVLTALRAVLTR